jgi:ribosomal protein S18 acetylase RimI-like enzyme
MTLAGSKVDDLELRELRPSDAAAVRALALAEIERSDHRSGPRAALDAAVGGADPEARGLVAVSDARIIGVVIFGTVAGSVGAGRLQLVVVDPEARRRGIATRLVHAAIDALATAGSRFVMVELPHAPSLTAASALLARCGFRLEASVGDYFRDGVDLAILRRAIGIS